MRVATVVFFTEELVPYHVRRVGIAIFVLFFAFMVPAINARGAALQSQSSGTLDIFVKDTLGRTISGAKVQITGSDGSQKNAITNSQGEVIISSLKVALFTLTVSKPGYQSLTIQDVSVTSRTTTMQTATLSGFSLSSLRDIGHVFVSARKPSLNTAPASTVEIPQQVFIDQGQPTVTRILDETPGISTVYTASKANAAAPTSLSYSTVRGSLSYETASLIDGHPVALGQLGYFNNNFLDPTFLGGIEIVKGPGAAATDVNNAINGSINYKIIEPSITPATVFNYGSDSYSGLFSSVLTRGTLKSGRLGWAVGYSVNGSPGPLQNYPVHPLTFEGDMINGQQVAGSAYTFGNIPGYHAFFLTSASALATAPFGNSNTLRRAELAKFRYAVSPASSIAFTYLGSQASYDINGSQGVYYNVPFTPGSSYHGNLGAIAPYFAGYYTSAARETDIEPLFEGEFSTRVRNDSLLARAYSATIDRFDVALNGSYHVPLDGTVLLCAPGLVDGGGICGPAGGPYNVAPVPTTFNGGLVTYAPASQASTQDTLNYLRGMSVEYDHPVSENLYSISVDSSKQRSSDLLTIPGLFSLTLVPPGTSQRTTAIMGRAILNPSPRLNVMLAAYDDIYHAVISPDGGTTLLQTTTGHLDGRAGASYRVNPNASIRASLGSAIADPYAALMNNAFFPQPTYVIGTTGPFYRQTVSATNLRPETSFGYDVGADVRLGSGYSLLTTDVYENTVQNEFIQSTLLKGTYNDGTHGLAPLYDTQYRNLGFARYAGLEVGLRRTPPIGVGYVLEGALIRAYPFDLPSGFYSEPGAPNSVNLPIVSGLNFQQGGIDATTAVPYSSGYGEISYHFKNSGLISFGETYYGPNNSFGRRGFLVANASARVPLTARVDLQVSFYNLFNAYSDLLTCYGCGVPVVQGDRTLGLATAGAPGPRQARIMLHFGVGH